VIDSVLNAKGKEKKLDGSTLQPTIPAKLLDTCQEEIYQVGRLIYNLTIFCHIFNE